MAYWYSIPKKYSFGNYTGSTSLINMNYNSGNLIPYDYTYNDLLYNIDNISNMINSFEVWMDNDVTMRKEYIENNLDKYIIEE